MSRPSKHFESDSKQVLAHVQAIAHVLRWAHAGELPVWVLSDVCARLQAQILSSDSPPAGSFSEAISQVRVRYTVRDGFSLSDLESILRTGKETKTLRLLPGGRVSLLERRLLGTARPGPSAVAIPTGAETEVLRQVLSSVSTASTRA